MKTKKYNKTMFKQEMASYLEKIGIKHIKYVAATIYGTSMMLNELEVRYLQAKCADIKDDAEFEEFKRNHRIHKNASRLSPIMPWLRCGRFDDLFDDGFFTPNSQLHMIVLRNERKNTIK
jgi:hypothetical protein